MLFLLQTTVVILFCYRIPVARCIGRALDWAASLAGLHTTVPGRWWRRLLDASEADSMLHSATAAAAALCLHAGKTSISLIGPNCGALNGF